ncbi:MAG: S9 family peptidase [Planctomycetes bacterium]|nr:S9 family peptidase [Planctomycetota bacterium]
MARTHRSFFAPLALLALSAPSLLALAQPPQSATEKKRLTLEQTFAGADRVSFSGTPPSVSFTRDGRHIELQREGKTVWLDPKTLATSVPVSADATATADAAAREAAILAALTKLPGFDDASAKRVAAGRRLASSDGNALLLDADNDLWFFRHGGDKASRLTDGSEDEENVRLSSDGRLASFVRANDLFLVETDSGRERRLTKDGSPERLNGKLDWVYQEEIYGRGNFQATWWSPTSRHLAFLSLDQSGVPHHPIVDHVPNRAELEDTRYPKAGDPNPTVRLGVARARDGRVTWVDLGLYSKDEPLVVHVGWTPDGKQLCYQVQDREQMWLDLMLADPDSGKPTRLLRESSASWVNRLDEPRWLTDGTFLWETESSGWKHVVRHAADGRRLGAITAGEWEVVGITAVDEAKRQLWFSARKESAVAVNHYRIGLDGSGLVRLTTGPGSHAVDWNGDKSFFLDRVSSVAFPTEIRLCDGADGRVLETVAKSEVKALAEYEYSPPQLFQIPTRDGFLMDATVVMPSPLEPTKKYPIWLPTYAGPDAPSVGDRWNGDAWTQFLAQQGYVVLQVNNRTSSQRGHAFISKCWKQLGVQELADLEDALAWIGMNIGYCDTTRVGITGWSYGGFMSAYALTHSKAFKLGVAGAGVYDWRLYDTIYTERYMRTPQNNPEGYAATSCIEAAKDLSGYLVLAHGTIDDNVHFQNTIQLAYALERAGIDRFEVMPYAKSRHGLGGPELNNHFRRITWKAIRERL